MKDRQENELLLSCEISTITEVTVGCSWVTQVKRDFVSGTTHER